MLKKSVIFVVILVFVSLFNLSNVKAKDILKPMHEIRTVNKDSEWFKITFDNGYITYKLHFSGTIDVNKQKVITSVNLSADLIADGEGPKPSKFTIEDQKYSVVNNKVKCEAKVRFQMPQKDYRETRVVTFGV